jgi:hypothetical protein
VDRGGQRRDEPLSEPGLLIRLPMCGTDQHGFGGGTEEGWDSYLLDGFIYQGSVFGF